MRKLFTLLFLSFTINASAYTPPCVAKPVAGGTNGEVYELYNKLINGVSTDTLYVGGSFTQVGSNNLLVNNIACLTLTNGNYLWHKLGTGVNGPVYAITRFNGKLYVAGNFTMAGGVSVSNIATWDGTNWAAVPLCNTGIIKDLEVSGGFLYAGGSFTGCGTPNPDANLYRTTNGTQWEGIGHSHPINSLMDQDDRILIASKGITQMLHSVWFLGINNIDNKETMAVIRYRDTLYASCKSTASSPTTDLLYRNYNNNWEPVVTNSLNTPTIGNSFSTLFADKDTLMIGGSFSGSRGGYAIQNHFNINRYSNNWLTVDGEICKFINFKGVLIAAGKFKKDINAPQTALGGIAYRHFNNVSTVETVKSNKLLIYPCPASHVLNIEGLRSSTSYTISTIMGQKMLHGETAKEIDINSLNTGQYIIQIGESRQVFTKK